jgi:hypothetical protein
MINFMKMKRLPYILTLTVAVLAFVTCQKRPELKIYNLELTDETVTAADNSAVITANYSYPGEIPEVWTLVSTSDDMTDPVESRAQLDETTITARISNLVGDTRYYYRFKYNNGVGMMETETRDFTTIGVPIISTAVVSSITTNSAVSGGNVINDNGHPILARGVCWSTEQNPTIDDQHTEDGSETGIFVSDITDLEAYTVYFVRAYATNEEGTGYGDNVMFVTQKSTPTVITSDITDITGYSAVCGGEVLKDNGFPVTERGVCWSRTENPTLDDSYTAEGTGVGVFASSMTGLSQTSTYYVRAYATNELGTTYGEQKSFTTLFVTCGLFTIDANGSQVYFSQGNLQYQASTNIFRFAEHQWDCIGGANTHISPDYSGWIDLFGWGTGSNPTNSSASNSYAVFIDWGRKPISNGGNEANLWRTLTRNEWSYVIYTRNTSSGIRYAKANVNGIKGLILLPDDWSGSIYTLNTTNSASAAFSSNIISESDWTDILEANGAIFLPTAGYRIETAVYGIGFYGHYWSSNYYNSDMAYGVNFSDSNFSGTYRENRSYGKSVRLVRSAE